MPALAILSLVGTLTLGVLMRWAFAGTPLPWGSLINLRHAHSHLGYYGVLFPLMWWAWARLGAPVPGRRLLAVYAAAVGASALGFAAEGYGPTAIAGSTTVLAVWIYSAWLLARWRPGRRGLGWLSPAPLAIVLGAALIPPVAVLSTRDAALSAQVAHSFLSILTLGALTPTALAVLDTEPPPAALWLAATLAGAFFLGPLRSSWTGLGLAALGLALGRSLWRARARSAAGLAWAGAVPAMLALGSGLLPYGYEVAIAGVHYLLLGPVLLSLARPLWSPPPPGWALGLYAALLGLFCAARGRGRPVGQSWPAMAAQ